MIGKNPRRAVYFVPKKHDIEPTENGSREAMRSWWAGQEAILNSSLAENEKELARGFLSAILKLQPTHADDAAIARGLALTGIDKSLFDAGDCLASFLKPMRICRSRKITTK